MIPFLRRRVERLNLLLGESVLRLRSFGRVIADLADGILTIEVTTLAIVASTLAMELDTIERINVKLRELLEELADDRAVERPPQHRRGLGSLVVAASSGGALTVRQRHGFDLLEGSRIIESDDVPRMCAALLCDRFDSDSALASWLQARGIESVASTQP